MDLQNYREQIDAIDDQLLQLFKERMSLARQIALYKKAHNLPILDAAREADKLTVIEEKAGGELSPYSRKLYALIFELSRAYQEGFIK